MSSQVAARLPETLSVVTLQGLAELAPGTAYVERVAFEQSETLVVLRYPFGRTLTVSIVAARHQWDHEKSPEWGRPVAVQVRIDQDGVRCTVVGASRGGPRRTRITLAQGLSLAEAGAHTVFVAERVLGRAS
jgi:hypothetical protein